MKKIFVVLVSIGLLLGACSKKSAPSAGTWTFKNVTYSPTFANYVLGAFTAYTQDNMPTASLAFTFNDSIARHYYDSLAINTQMPPNATPPRMGTYTYYLSNQNPPPTGYVFVRMTDTSARRNYISVPSNSNTINVKFDGTVTQVEVAGITLMKDNNPADSATLTARITQLNYK